MKEADLTQELPTDRVELAVRYTVGFIMSGRFNVDLFVVRMIDRGFETAEIAAILKEAYRRTVMAGEAADRAFYQRMINTGAALLLMAIGLVAIVGYPQHGRGVGIFYSAIVFGLGALGYGAFGKMFRH